MTLGWPWPFLHQGQLRPPMHLNGKKRKMSFNGKKLAKNEQMDRRFMFTKIFWAQSVVCPCPRAIYPGAIYMCMTIIFKHLLLWNLLVNQSQTLCGALLGRVNESLYKWSKSHDQDGRNGYKQQKPLKIFFSRTRRPMILKLGMKHQAMKLYKVYINHDPGMILTFFTARSTHIWMGKIVTISFEGQNLQ